MFGNTWTEAELVEYSGVSRNLADNAQKRANNGRMYVTPQSKETNKRSDSLSAETIAKIEEFYFRNDISMELPGIQDTIKGKKKFTSGESWDIYIMFKAEFPDDKVGLCKFCTYKPILCPTRYCGNPCGMCM